MNIVYFFLRWVLGGIGTYAVIMLGYIALAMLGMEDREGGMGIGLGLFMGPAAGLVVGLLWAIMGRWPAPRQR